MVRGVEEVGSASPPLPPGQGRAGSHLAPRATSPLSAACFPNNTAGAAPIPPADARSGLLTSPGASCAHHLRGEAARAGDLTRPLRLSLSLSRRERSGRAPTSRMSVREMSTGRSPLPLASFVGTGPSAGAVAVGRARSACPQLPRRPLGHADTPPALGLTPGGTGACPEGPWGAPTTSPQ